MQQVVVGLNVKEGDLGIYFPTDTCLGKDFAAANNDLLTYFGKNFRVRTQKFRGEKSEGFWCEIKCVSDLLGYAPNKGEEFTSVNLVFMFTVLHSRQKKVFVLILAGIK